MENFHSSASAAGISLILRSSVRLLSNQISFATCWVIEEPPCTVSPARRLVTQRPGGAAQVDAEVPVEAAVLGGDDGVDQVRRHLLGAWSGRAAGRARRRSGPRCRAASPTRPRAGRAARRGRGSGRGSRPSPRASTTAPRTATRRPIQKKNRKMRMTNPRSSAGYRAQARPRLASSLACPGHAPRFVFARCLGGQRTREIAEAPDLWPRPSGKSLRDRELPFETAALNEAAIAAQVLHRSQAFGAGCRKRFPV